MSSPAVIQRAAVLAQQKRSRASQRRQNGGARAHAYDADEGDENDNDNEVDDAAPAVVAQPEAGNEEEAAAAEAAGEDEGSRPCPYCDNVVDTNDGEAMRPVACSCIYHAACLKALMAQEAPPPCTGCQVGVRRAVPAVVCTVCLDHIGHFNGVSLPGCHHYFHRACLEKSYASHNDSCPNCRVPVVMWPFDRAAVQREARDSREQNEFERDAEAAQALHDEDLFLQDSEDNSEGSDSDYPAPRNIEPPRARRRLHAPAAAAGDAAAVMGGGGHGTHAAGVELAAAMGSGDATG